MPQLNNRLTYKVDLLNTVMIFGSLALAMIIPFKLFLFSYAVLGPLHYLTEINWLHSKNYFETRVPWIWIGLVVVSFVAFPKLLSHAGLLDTPVVGSVAIQMDQFSNGLIFLSLWSAFSLAFIRSKKWAILSLLIGVGIAVGLNSTRSYLIFVALMVPTLIHVYLFTLLFMVYGSIKAKAKIGGLNSLLLVLAPVVIILFDIDNSFYQITEWIKSTFVDNGFHITSIELGRLIGITDGSQYFFYGNWELKAQQFIAFAYIYHYLNWFSKTSIIGWSDNLNWKKTTIILAIWAVFASLFIVDYSLGFVSIVGLSFLHVVLEFPLNATSVKGILKSINQQLLPQS